MVENVKKTRFGTYQKPWSLENFKLETWKWDLSKALSKKGIIWRAEARAKWRNFPSNLLWIGDEIYQQLDGD